MIGALILAAGSGRRMKRPINKVYLDLAGRSVLSYSLEIFGQVPDLAGILLVIRKEDQALAEAALAQSGTPKAMVTMVAGGEDRQDSVCQALAAVPAAWSQVLIHDGARPLVSSEVIARVRAGIDADTAVTPGSPVTDTLKRVDAQGYVTQSIDRTGVMGLQTPQGFDVRTLVALHDVARTQGHRFTDDTSLYEASGKKIRVVAGDPNNLKVTYPEDLDRALGILARRKSL